MIIWILTLLIFILVNILLINYIYSLKLNFSILWLYNYKINLPGLALWYSGILIGIFVIIIADVKVFFKKTLLIIFMFFFIFIIWCFINETNYFNLFLYYELFLLPSFFLVYYLSPNRRSILASIYFLTWTQLGSVLVLVALLIVYTKYGTFETITQPIYSITIFFLLFFGFGIKIPMWPFYYWLTKTHVEASSFFSIYLSGFLVKTAVYLFLKFYSIFSLIQYSQLFLILFLIGVIDSSIKMWHQLDLKKLIAFTTVQEMNFLMIPVLWNDYLGEILISFFIITHCLLSTIFFFFIDIINKRFNTRVATQITGLIHVMPTFTLILFLSWIGFSGLPFTIKFTLEICIFNYLLQYNFFLTIISLIIMNIIGLIGFSKAMFNVLFGAPILKDLIIMDLTKRELFLFIFLLLNLILLNILTLVIN